MKSNKVKYFPLLVIAIAAISFSCRKIEYEDPKYGGCLDINSPDFDSEVDYDDFSCKYAYATAYEISNYPPKDSNGDDWDVFATSGSADADLLLTVYDIFSGDIVFSSVEKGDWPPNEAAKWTALTDFKLSNKKYGWTLYDNDVSGKEYIAGGNFNPIDLILSTNSVVTADTNYQNDVTTFKIYFDLK